MTVVVQHRMPASTERVWDLLSDVERMAGLGPENVATRWVDPGPAVGARFAGRNLREGREWTVTCLVTVCDRPSAFEWIVGEVAEPSSTWRYDLTDEGAGGTLVTHLFRHGPGFTFLRRAVEKCPEMEHEYVLQRGTELSRSMEATLTAAGERLRAAADE